MKRFGLIGHPISHSLSPLLFKAGYGGRYAYDLIEGSDFILSFNKFIDSYDGVNVTSPFKEAAFLRADSCSEECKEIGAANIAVKTPDGIKVYNSDYYGVMLALVSAFAGSENFSDLMKSSPDLYSVPLPVRQFKRLVPHGIATCLIVGAGGAARAAAAAASALGLKTTIMNRTVSKAEMLASEIGQGGFEVRPIEEFVRAFTANDVIIYAIPQAIEGVQAAKQIVDEAKSANSVKYVLEANYRSPVFDASYGSERRQCTMRGNGGCHYISGIQWLLYQALTGYKIFTGSVPDMKSMSAALDFYEISRCHSKNYK